MTASSGSGSSGVAITLTVNGNTLSEDPVHITPGRKTSNSDKPEAIENLFIALPIKTARESIGTVQCLCFLSATPRRT